jgi:hypothetical protein
MAQFTRVNGDFKQVLWLDAPDYTNTGVNAVTSAVTVQPQGPKLDFFTLTGNGSQIADNIQATFQTIQQLATIHIYEYNNATDDTLAIAVYPAGGWTTTTLDAAFANAWTSANVTATVGATFTGDAS